MMNKSATWGALKSTLERYPSISHPIWKTYYRLFPREGHWMRPIAGEDRTRAFSAIFANNDWSSDESRSGKGSALAGTIEVRKRLPDLLLRYSVRTFLDAPCGDFNWMRLVQMPTGVHYIGADIVPDLIASLNTTFANEAREFMALDIVQGALPDADLWLCRHALFHLPNADILTVLKRFKESNIRYLLTTNHDFCRKNHDINPGGFRFLNLRREPFNLPKPVMQFDDCDILGPPAVLSLWSRDQIPDYEDDAEALLIRQIEHCGRDQVMTEMLLGTARLRSTDRSTSRAGQAAFR